MNKRFLILAVGAAVALVCGTLITHYKMTPTNQYDVEIAKIEAQVALDKANSAAGAHERKLRCVVELKNLFGQEYIVNHPQAFYDLVYAKCD